MLISADEPADVHPLLHAHQVLRRRAVMTVIRVPLSRERSTPPEQVLLYTLPVPLVEATEIILPSRRACPIHLVG